MLGDTSVVQKRLGVPATGKWDAATRGAMIAYQQSRGGPLPVVPSGHPDPNTLINLGYYDPLDHMAHSQVDYLGGGEYPSGVGRDVVGVFNQVPRWAWLGLGAGMLVMAYVSYRRAYKEKT